MPFSHLPLPFTYELLPSILQTLFVYRFWLLPERASIQCPHQSLPCVSQSARKSPSGDILFPINRGLTNGQSRICGKGPWPT